jgi:hypothetical protein
MLKNITELYGNTLVALDGDIGQVKDFYFDDKTWVVRYLVADTGTWLAGRLVLLSPQAFGHFDPYNKTLQIELSRNQIECSPPIEAHRPVSRQHEMEYYRYYGWPAYWDGGAMWGLAGYPMVRPPTKDQMEAHLYHHHRDDKHLRSTQAVMGYHIESIGGTIGHVSGLMVDDRSWAVRELVVETGHWFSGKEILISPGKVDHISYDESKVYVNLTREDILETADHEVARTGGGNHRHPGARNFTD